MIAGLNHDHIFVPWERRGEALAILSELGGSHLPPAISSNGN